MEIANRTFIVTGASSGLGAQVSLALLRNGARVALAARRGEALERLASTEGLEGRGLAVPTDLGSNAQIDRLIDATLARFGDLHGVVHCAGIAAMSGLEQMDPDRLENVVRLNLLAPMLLTRRALPALRAQPSSVIALVSSLSGLVCPPLQAPYVATKAAVGAFAQSLRRELDGTGVHVLVAWPGVMDTPMIEDFRVAADRTGFRPPMAILEPDRAAAILLDAIRRDRPEVVVGDWRDRLMAVLGRRAPWVLDRMFRRARPEIERLALAEAAVRAERESTLTPR